MSGPLCWSSPVPPPRVRPRWRSSVARGLGAEIVSADSQQVYRHFDIGTAKPSAEELARGARTTSSP